jgi:hypothetical protein
MVSTYLSYDLINRDMKKSLNRVAQDAITARETNYYKENIAKVKTLDEFMGDYKLYSYAMDAFGLSEMTYAKAFMKQVLESDLNDDNSFANRLSDERYRDFAAAFNFSAATETPQTDAQLDDLIGLYKSSIDDMDKTTAEETRYYKAIVGSVDNVDKLLQNDRARAYMFKVFDVDESSYSYAHIRGLLTSDMDDPNSYLNQKYGADYNAAAEKIATRSGIQRHPEAVKELAAVNADLAKTDLTPKDRTDKENKKVDLEKELASLNSSLPPESTWDATVKAIDAELTKLTATTTQYNKMAKIAAAFEFNPDGSVEVGKAQTADNLTTMTDTYITKSPRVTPTVAVLNQEYFEKRISEATSLADLNLSNDTRLKDYIIAAFGMKANITVAATIEMILTSDPDDPASRLNAEYGGKEPYLSLNKAFNFNTDGSLPIGVKAQTAEQTKSTKDGYMTRYNDTDDAADARALVLYNSDIKSITSVSDFVSSTAVYDYALKAVGLDPKKVEVRTIRQVLQSDIQDPKSFVNKLGDERYVKLAELFNFKSDGSVGAPILAQSEFQVQSISADYIKAKSAFGTAADKKTAEAEAKYYGEEMQKVKKLDDLLANKRLTTFAMISFGIDPESVTPEKLKEIFKSDLEDPDSAVNQETNAAFRRLVTAFNFDTEGKMLREDRSQIQNRRGLYETLDSYLRQTLETQAGNENAGVRLALYFERMAKTTTSYYTILADTPLQEFINATFGIPDELSNAEVDTQVDTMKKYFDIEDFQDPEKVKKLIARFTVMYDSENTSDPIMTLFNGSASAGISGDTLLAVAMLRAG